MSYEPSNFFIAEQVAEFILKDSASKENPKAYDIASEINENYGLQIDSEDVKKHFKEIYGADYEKSFAKLASEYPSYFHGIDEDGLSDIPDGEWEEIVDFTEEDFDLLGYDDEQ